MERPSPFPSDNVMTGKERRPCVVVVEDHDIARRTLARLLEANGYDVRPAATIQEALYVIERHGCDLLISDMILPDGTGLELMRALAERRQAPVAIAMTGKASAEDQTECAKAGFGGFVPKPILFTQLLTEVERLLPH